MLIYANGIKKRTVNLAENSSFPISRFPRETSLRDPIMRQLIRNSSHCNLHSSLTDLNYFRSTLSQDIGDNATLRFFVLWAFLSLFIRMDITSKYM